MMSRLLLPAAFAALFAAPACADVAGMRDAISAMDPAALVNEAASEGPAEQALAKAVADSWMRHDPAITFELAAAAARQTEPALKAAGLRALMSLYVRRGEFAAAIVAGRDVAALEPLDLGERQTLAFVEALVGVPPTRLLSGGSGIAPVRRDLAGLMRSDIAVGAESVAAILDTGANFSTINETSARRLGLRMLDAAVSVGSSSRDSVASRLGVADKLSFAGAEFSDVVFIVLPDADLSFADGAYTIDAILGMPVFLQMKRIEIATRDGAEVFAFGQAAADVGDAGRNILFSALSPMAQISVDVASVPVGLSMLLDTGAQETSFEGNFAARAAPLLDAAATVTSTHGGAGGVVTSDIARRLPEVTLTVGGNQFSIKDVDYHPSERANRAGLLGLDTMGDRFVIDWDRGVLMTVVSPRPEAASAG